MKDSIKKLTSLSINILFVASVFATVVYAQNNENISDISNSTVNNSTISNSTIGNSTIGNSTIGNSTTDNLPNSNSTNTNSTYNTNMLLNGNFTNGSTIADYWVLDKDKYVHGNVTCVTAQNVQYICYKGQSEDNYTQRMKIYQAPITGVAAGDKLRFSIWVNGNVTSSPTIIGISAFNSSGKWLNESDTYINVTNTPKLYEVTYVCPQNTSYVAVYLDSQEINPNTIIDIALQRATLVLVP